MGSDTRSCISRAPHRPSRIETAHWTPYKKAVRDGQFHTGFTLAFNRAVTYFYGLHRLDQ
jgi:hypothetical protein